MSPDYKTQRNTHTSTEQCMNYTLHKHTHLGSQYTAQQWLVLRPEEARLSRLPRIYQLMNNHKRRQQTRLHNSDCVTVSVKYNRALLEPRSAAECAFIPQLHSPMKVILI